MEGSKYEGRKAKYELRGRHISQGGFEVVKEEEKKDQSKGKAIHWKRRSRKTKQQRRWIVDSSTSRKRHQQVLWSTSREKKEGHAGEALKVQVKLT
jgi:hypothetical protein